MANDIICEISSENELICEMSSAGEIVVEVNGMTYQSVAAELAEKASVEDVALKADKTYVDDKLSEKADKTYVDSQDALKADKSTTYTKAEVDTSLGLKANKQQEAWITPTLLNGWEHHTAGATPSFFKDGFGFVHIRGFIKNPNNAASGTVFRLPIGYRPSYTVRLSIRNTASTQAGLDIMADGSVIAITSNKAEVSLDGVSFKVGA